MKHLLIGILAGMALCLIATAQNSATPQPGQAQTQQSTSNANALISEQTNMPSSSAWLRVAPGSVIPVQLTKTIDAKKLKAGDEVEARVTQDMKSGTGEVLIPKDAKVVGHVTEDQPRSKEEKESQIAIAFDHIVMRNGTGSALPMSIQAIIAPPESRPDNGATGDNPSTAPPQVGMPSTGTMGRNPGMSSPSQMPAYPPAGTDLPGNQQSGANSHQPISGNTQGVVGISNLTLSTGNSSKGSLITSGKNNVKLESGTVMLLRVSQ
jgi:hypothetical protein